MMSSIPLPVPSDLSETVVCNKCSPRTQWISSTHETNEPKKSRNNSPTPFVCQLNVILRTNTIVSLRYTEMEDEYWYAASDFYPFIESLDHSNDIKKRLKQFVPSEFLQQIEHQWYVNFEGYCSIIDYQLNKGFRDASFVNFSALVDICAELKKIKRERECERSEDDENDLSDSD